MHIYQEILDARRRIEGKVLRTPLLHSAALSALTGGQVFLKMESEQRTGSFKLRGATNKIYWLEERNDRSAVFTASTGNHGLGVASALSATGRQGCIVVPRQAASTKVRALKALGVKVEQHGDDCFVSETYARQRAEAEGAVYISPYNDPQIIGGQGTVACELLEQLPEKPDNIFVTVGGGGLIAGIGTYLRNEQPDCRIYGCQPALSAEMALSVQRNTYTTVEARETLSDASAGPFEADSITFPLCRDIVDEFFLAEEDRIGRGICWMLDHERKLVEGAAAVALAPLLRDPKRWRGQCSVVVICGGNISREKLRLVLEDHRADPS